MNDLLTTTQQIWTTVQQSIEDAMASGNTLDGIKTFVKQRLHRGAQIAQPVLHALTRVTSVTEVGGSRGLGELSITFGLTSTTVRPGQVMSDLEEMAFDLARLFLNSPYLGGLSDDVRLDELDSDAQLFGPEDTQLWVTVRLVWQFQYLRT